MCAIVARLESTSGKCQRQELAYRNVLTHKNDAYTLFVVTKICRVRKLQPKYNSGIAQTFTHVKLSMFRVCGINSEKF